MVKLFSPASGPPHQLWREAHRRTTEWLTSLAVRNQPRRPDLTGSTWSCAARCAEPEQMRPKLNRLTWDPGSGE